MIQESYANGYITEDDYIKLSAGVDREISNLDVKSYNWRNKEINELELIEPSFSKLNKEYLKQIKDNYIKCDFRTG